MAWTCAACLVMCVALLVTAKPQATENNLDEVAYQIHEIYQGTEVVAGEVYNVLKVTAFIGPQLTLTWYKAYNWWMLLPISEGSLDLATPITTTNNDGLTTTILKQRLIEPINDHYEIGLRAESLDHCFTITVQDVGIFDNSQPLKTVRISSPEQPYVTEIPTCIAPRLQSDHAPSTFVTRFELWTPDPGFTVHILFMDEIAESPYYRSRTLYNPMYPERETTIEGVEANVVVEKDCQLTKISVEVRSQVTGLLRISGDTSDRSRIITTSTQFLAHGNTSWTTRARHQGTLYVAWQYEAFSSELQQGENLVLACPMASPNIKAEDIYITKDGQKLPKLVYSNLNEPGRIIAFYEGNGTEDGEYVCYLEDDVTPLYMESTMTVSRID